MEAAERSIFENMGTIATGPSELRGSSSYAINNEQVYDSDRSWTHEEDSGSFYIDIRRQLEDFAQAISQQTTTTAMLTRGQRRFVHASAQTMGLGHASLGAHSKSRRMIIFKTDDYSLGMSNLLVSQQKNGMSTNLLEASGTFSYGRRAKRQRRAGSADGRFQGQLSIPSTDPERLNENTWLEPNQQLPSLVPLWSSQHDGADHAPVHAQRRGRAHRAASLDTDLMRDSRQLMSSSRANPASLPRSTAVTDNGNSGTIEPIHFEANSTESTEPSPLGTSTEAISKTQVLLACGFRRSELIGFGLEEDEVSGKGIKKPPVPIRKHFIGI